ncbi:CheW protein [Geothermobacter ehrlichii]|uniref:Chemotaxis protein CheW n=1 Tax=Geothermobacter ehrlichii TaxID=213224 RepID=A0A5D3WRJ7_9BACT|nr:chemotaxis protein CheW [Geothermobacter ehrlichii]TYP00219.1 CheW protein [Geothermobacter ehrlichii]
MENAVVPMELEASEEVVDGLKGKYLTFHIADEDYGIEIRHVTEIIGIQAITDVPDLPEFIRGVINLRGNVIPVMDVRLRFRLPEKPYEERTCIVVVNVDDKTVGLVVDRVNEVVDISDKDIEPPPRTKSESSQYILGMGKIGDQVKILLDVRRLLYSEEMEKFRQKKGE